MSDFTSRHLYMAIEQYTRLLEVELRVPLVELDQQGVDTQPIVDTWDQLISDLYKLSAYVMKVAGDDWYG